jgi:hypothetical protein
VTTPTFSRHAVATLFLERQHLDRPRARRLTATSLARFAEDAGGIQLDSINVVDRAHHLTLWSRFGPYERRTLDRLVYRRRVLFEYWAHVACLVPASHHAWWRRAMADYGIRHTGWQRFLRREKALLDRVEQAIRERGPLGNGDFAERRPGGGAGWWNWKPATHALHYLWMSGRTAVHSRSHFQKRFDLAERVLPAVEAVAVPDADAFARWHVERQLHAMGAATETDLRMYLSYPRIPAPRRRKTLASMLRDGTVVEVRLDGARGRWFALGRDMDALAAAGRRRAASRGATLLSPFDSLLWHRERVAALFGFDYRIEVYVPAAKRTFGYYALPLLVDGHFAGRVDAKLHRAARRLELKRARFEPWVARGEPPPAARWGGPTRERVFECLAESAWSLAAFCGATALDLGRIEPAGLARAMRTALAAAPRPDHVAAELPEDDGDREDAPEAVEM